MSTAGRLREGLAMAALAAATLALLVYVALGEARRTWPRFVIERIAAEGALLATPMEGFLREGLPLDQFPGFSAPAEAALAASPVLSAVVARDAGGRVVFAVGDPAAPPGDDAPALGPEWLVVSLPLESRYETVGRLELAARRAAVLGPAERLAGPLAALAGAAALGAGVVAAATAGARRARAWAAGGFALAYAAAAAGVVALLAGLYAEGAEGRAQALAATLAQRVAPIFAWGLTLDEVTGLDALFAEVRALNPDILAAALTLDGVAAAHSDPAAVGRPWTAEAGSYQFAAPVPGAPGAAAQAAVSLPADVVWRATARSVKNFAALFLASALVAALALGALRAARREGAEAQNRLALLRLTFFAAVAAESLSASFLPQLMRAQAAAAGFGAGAASAAFTLYFAAFTVALLAGGAWVRRAGARGAVAAGAALAALGALGPALAQDFQTLALGRLVAGAGQGLIFIGVQAAALAAVEPARRTRAAAVIVFGFNGGVIAGAAVGALLLDDIGAHGVFAAAAALAAGAALAALAALDARPAGGAGGGWRALGEPGFWRALLLVGAPAKAALTGVAAFALPLTLADRGWATEDIGQIVMLYGAGVLAASGAVARLVDRRAGAETALTVGALGSAVALWAIAAAPAEGAAGALVAAGGAFALGLAHACVNAPVVTFVAGRSADPAGAVARYRVAERAGHVAGPALAGQAIAAAGGGDGAMALFAVGVGGCGALFLLGWLRRTSC